MAPRPSKASQAGHAPSSPPCIHLLYLPWAQVPVLMTYDGELLSVRPATLGGALHLVLVDLRASKNTVAILKGLQVRPWGDLSRDSCAA